MYHRYGNLRHVLYLYHCYSKLRHVLGVYHCYRNLHVFCMYHCYRHVLCIQIENVLCMLMPWKLNCIHNITQWNLICGTISLDRPHLFCQNIMFSPDRFPCMSIFFNAKRFLTRCWVTIDKIKYKTLNFYLNSILVLVNTIVSKS